MTDPRPDPKDALLDAAVIHVPFDGWSEATFRAAVNDSDIDAATARIWYPRGAVDLAVSFHKRADNAMAQQLAAADLSDLRFRDRIAQAIRIRLEVAGDVEAIRRAAALFALPTYAAEGARLIWGTADAIWTALGDTSDDLNWYTKRATLSGVYASTVLFWLGDESPDLEETWAFLDRRIDNVMQIEKAKSAVRKNPVLSRLMRGPEIAASRIRRPGAAMRTDLPGHIAGQAPK